MENSRAAHHPTAPFAVFRANGIADGSHLAAPAREACLARGDADERTDGHGGAHPDPGSSGHSSASPRHATAVSVVDDSEDLASTVPARSIGDTSPPPTNSSATDFSTSTRSPRRRLRHALVALSVAELLILLGLCAASKIPFRPFDIRLTVADVVVVEAVRASLVLLCMVIGSIQSVRVAQMLNALALFSALTGKLWVYDGWKDSVIRSVVVLLAPVAATVTFVGCWLIRDIDNAAQTTLRFSAIVAILKPYFVPRSGANRFLVAATWSALLAGKACGIIAPIFLGRAVSDLTAQPRQSPYADIGWFVVLQFASRLCAEVQDLCFYRIMQAAYVETTEATFRQLTSLSLEWHLRKKVGFAIRSMSRGLQAAENVMVYLVLNMLPTLGAALASFAVFVVEFNAREVAAVCHVGLAVYCWAAYVLTLWRRKFNEELNDFDNALHETATDSLVNVETVKYFGSEEFELQRVVGRAVHLQRANFKTQLAEFVVQTSQSTIIQLSMLGALLLSAMAILQSRPDVGAGEFVAIQAYVLTIFSPLTYLGYTYSMVISSLVAMQDLTELLNEKADVVDRPDAKPLQMNCGNAGGDRGDGAAPPPTPEGKDTVSATGATVSFEDVTFRYPSQLPDQGLHGVSFTIPAGTTTAVVGATGSGKTTLSRLLFRFYDVLGGKIAIDGQDISAVTQSSLRQTIGMVPQDTCMFNDTIRFNIAYGKPDATDEEVRAAAEQARILGFVEALSEGWDTPVGERGLKLSGGEKQRVAIARCLLKNPPIVVLDEATSALDNSTERDVQAALRALEGRTTLVIAHRLTTVQHADQIIVLKQGRVAEIGTHTELLGNPDSEYSALWTAQQQHGVEDCDEDEAGEGEEEEEEDRATLVSCSEGCSPTSTLCQRVMTFAHRGGGGPLADWSAEVFPSLLQVPLRPATRRSSAVSSASSLRSFISDHSKKNANLDSAPLVPVLVSTSSSCNLKERTASFPYNQTLSHAIS